MIGRFEQTRLRLPDMVARATMCNWADCQHVTTTRLESNKMAPSWEFSLAGVHLQNAATIFDLEMLAYVEQILVQSQSLLLLLHALPTQKPFNHVARTALNL